MLWKSFKQVFNFEIVALYCFYHKIQLLYEYFFYFDFVAI